MLMLPRDLSVNSFPEISIATKPFNCTFISATLGFGPRGTKPSSPPERKQLAQYSSSRLAE